MTKLKLKITAITLLLFGATGIYGQGLKVGDNPGVRNANSALEIESTNQGVAFPNVALSATNSINPLKAGKGPLTGTIVYNTATAGSSPNNVTPGFYFWDGSAWQRLVNGNTGTAGTYTKVTTDAFGRVTSGSSLSASDIPSIDWSKITSGKPTTIAGYGITDAVSASRTITINGNTFDLSANRSFSVGTVTSTSVASANGFTGTVATASSTPAITIGTSVTGLLKGNGTGLSAAVAGTDYLAPFGSQTANTFYAAPNGSAGAPVFRAIEAADIPTLNQNTTGTAANVTGTVAVANGGTGLTTTTAYGVILGGTTATGAFQNAGAGDAGQVLTSNGSGTAPTWKNPEVVSHIYKSANTSRTSTTTFAADPDLAFTTASSTTYGFKIVVFFGSANNTPDFKFRINHSTSVTNIQYMAQMRDNDVQTFTHTVNNALAQSVTLATNDGVTGANVGYVCIEGTVEVSTAGTFSFEWAQNASNGNATQVIRGSNLQYWVIP